MTAYEKTLINGLSINYRIFGNGNKNMLLLHGWGQSHSFWDTFINRYKHKYKLFTLDLPGFGLSDEPTTVWSLSDYAGFINQFVTKLSITNPILVGHSFGGKIALVYSLKYMIKKIVLYSTDGAVANEYLSKRIYRNIIIKLGKLIFPELLYRYQNTAFKPDSYRNNFYVNKDRARRMLDIYNHTQIDLSKKIRGINSKCLIIVGNKDYISNPKTGSVMNKLIKNSTLVETPNATHFSHLEEPKKFFYALNIFLNQKD